MTYDGTAFPPSAWPAAFGTPASRLLARLMPWRYDRQLLAGVAPEPGGALAAHIARLTSDTERRQLISALGFVVREAGVRPTLYSSRIPLDEGTVSSAVTHIDEVRVRLEASRPVRALGVARLRLLLSDGAGPFYEDGRGNLTVALREVLAEL